ADFLGAMNWIDGTGVRPEAVSICAEGRKAVVTSVTYLGSFCHIATTLVEGGQAVLAQAPAGSAYQPGQTVCVTWNSEDEVRL
ncbi:MAG: TOBE domain-containing protein, partial [Bryobacteraceae bacterium]